MINTGKQFESDIKRRPLVDRFLRTVRGSRLLREWSELWFFCYYSNNYGHEMLDFGATEKLATVIVATSCSRLSARIASARRLEKIRLNDTARLSHRLRPRHLVSRHMGRDGTSTLAVAPRDHYCGGGGIGHCRVAGESSAIKPSIPVPSLANDLAASLFSGAPTGFVGATAGCAGSESQTQLRSIDVRWYRAPCRARQSAA
jgi:hypothetical protein